MNRYPVSLAPVDSNNVEKGAYPQVTGLQTPYIFRKLYITANPENESITKYFNFVKVKWFFTSFSKYTVAHNISIKTSTFKPTLKLSADKKYVEKSNCNLTDT